MPKFDEFRRQTIPVYLASEYWYCAAIIFHSTRLGQVSSMQRNIGREMHELKAVKDLQSLEGIVIPISPENLEQLKEFMLQQVNKAMTDKIVLTNSDETTLYYGILSELKCAGKPDAIDCTDGVTPIVVERKFVKHPLTEPWFDHKIQAQLYMMTLQELGFPSVKSRIEYWSQVDNQLISTFELDPDDELRERAIQGIESTIKILKGSDDLIPTNNANKCRVCEYRVLCKWRADIPEYQPPYFLDIETNVESNLVWCVGIFDPIGARFSQFFLEPGVDESSILKDSIDLLSQRPSSRILSFSGSAFDSRILRRQLEAHNVDENVTRRIIDVHPSICWRLGEKSLGGLKVIATESGYRFSYPGFDGIQAALLYSSYQKKKAHAIKDLLMTYNKDDVMALVHLALTMPDHFDHGRLVVKIEYAEIETLRRFYESSRLIIRSRAGRGLEVELRFRCYSDEDSRVLSTLLEKHGFNPRFGFDKKTRVIRIYGYSQVSDLLSLLGVDLEKILSRHNQSALI